MPESDRPYDIVLWGATGVAGRLTADYLTAQYAPDELTLALGGRNADRLEAVESDIIDQTSWEEVPIVLGDATEPDSLAELARSTRVVCTTVGPYTKYGTPLVEACVDAGTHYCDLTGEINWIRETVDAYHEEAVDAEARIVHSCGFDSVPADLGTLVVQSFAEDTFGTPCETVRIYVEAASGGVSGGTLASFAALYEAASKDPVARETIKNPYSLAPPGEREGPDPGEQRRPRNDPLRGAWTAPSPMASVNERVVRRSNALLAYPWGESFRCTEVMTTGRGIGGAARATGIAAGLGLFSAAMAVGPLRAGLQRYVFPDPGTGPTSEETEQGHFRIRVLGEGIDDGEECTVTGTIGADWGPGYGATARMLGESAVCLLRDDIDSPFDGGVLTPASGIGMPLADRLRSVGFTVTAEET